MKSAQVGTESPWIWWKHGIIYHIYPLSFKDTDHDGYGDLSGIIQSIDYLKNLGVDAIWLSPVFKSPFKDFGYDISDYYSIDERFGTMDVFRELLRIAHTNQIKVILDLVMNHTSDQHPWFIESASSPANPKSDWYLWHEGKGGRRPNNWKSAAGGSAWTFHEGRNAYYYHSFFDHQPDLNWRNKEMQTAFFNQVRFWLDMGVDGFRLDVINMVVKDKKFRNNPVLDLLDAKKRSFTRNRPKSYKIIRKLRKLVDEYESRVLLGEIYTPPPGDPYLAASYLGNEKQLLHLAFDFSIMFRHWNAAAYYKTFSAWIEAVPPDGWPCFAFSNHDLSRYINRFGISLYKEKKSKIVATLLLTMPGTPVMYYGDEIGMRNRFIGRPHIRDPLGKRFWPFYRGRDKARTPMQWNALKNAGFSSGLPWLPVNTDYRDRNVDAQIDRPHALLTFYFRLIQLRKTTAVLQKGEWEPIWKGENGLIGYYRSDGLAKALIILNFTAFAGRSGMMVTGSWKVSISTHRIAGEICSLKENKIFPFEATVFLQID